jgi:hypothetical protein
MEWSHRATRLATCLVFTGMAVRMGIRLVRGCVVDRWFTVLACVAVVVGAFVNSDGSPTAGMIFLGALFSLCAIGLLTPFAGRHFVAKPLPDDHLP